MKPKRGSVSSGAVPYFDQSASHYEEFLLDTPSFRERYMVYESWMDRIKAQRGDRPTLCIDLGCGPGPLSIAAARRGFQTIGVDGSQSMLLRARRAASTAMVEVEFRHAPLPLPLDTLASYMGPRI